MAKHNIKPTDPQAEVQGVLHREPTSIAEALDLDARLGALSGWVNDRKRAVSGWVHDKAEARREEDGAAPTWRMDQGTVLLTDPDPKPRLTDHEAFGRWYVTVLLGRDPDEKSPEGEYLLRFDNRVARRVVATCPSDVLLAFLNAEAAEFARANDGMMATVPREEIFALTSAIHVEEQWMAEPEILDALVAGKVHANQDTGKPRVILNPTALALIDRDTGESIPGTTVSPPSKRSVQMRPSADTKTEVRAELDRLLGPAELAG